MELRYYSQWVFYLFLIWGVGYVWKISWITTYLSPYYMTMFASIGFTGLLVYWTSVKGQSFEPTFLLFLMLIHYGPFYLSYRHASREYALHTLLITFSLYLWYMSSQDLNPFHTYLIEKQPESWEDLAHACERLYISPLCKVYLKVRETI